MHTYTGFKLPRWALPLLLLPGLILGNAGCASIVSRAATSDPASAVSGCDVRNLSVTNVHWFKDSGGAWRVVGVIINHSSKAVSKLETGVETRTSSDAAADQGEDIAAYPLNLQPGQQAPYTAWIDRDIPGLDHFEVEIAECVLAEPAERSQVDVRSGRVVVDDAGTAQVTAELFNPSSKAVLVNGLMAAVYDAAGVMITAQYADVSPRYLASTESGPVRASLDLPPGAGPKVNSFKLFMDVLVNQPAALPLNAQQDVKLFSHYTDQAGRFHQLGEITNSTSASLMTSLQAGVYADASKSQLADAAQMTTWVPLAAGETLSFDLADWGALNQTRGLAEQWSGQNNGMDLRLEPFLTWTTTAKVKALAISDGSVSYKGGQALFTGKATNEGDGGITAGLVNAVLREKSSRQLVAVGSAHLGITDSAAPGQVLYYSITIPLPKNIDPAGLEAEVSASGYQP